MFWIRSPLFFFGFVALQNLQSSPALGTQHSTLGATKKIQSIGGLERSSLRLFKFRKREIYCVALDIYSQSIGQVRFNDSSLAYSYVYSTMAFLERKNQKIK